MANTLIAVLIAMDIALILAVSLQYIFQYLWNLEQQKMNKLFIQGFEAQHKLNEQIFKALQGGKNDK